MKMTATCKRERAETRHRLRNRAARNGENHVGYARHRLRTRAAKSDERKEEQTSKPAMNLTKCYTRKDEQQNAVNWQGVDHGLCHDRGVVPATQLKVERALVTARRVCRLSALSPGRHCTTASCLSWVGRRPAACAR